MPGRARPAPAATACRSDHRQPAPPTRREPASGTKTARFLALVTERHGPLAAVPVTDVSPICTALAPVVGLNAGAARTALRQAVLAAQNGSTS